MLFYVFPVVSVAVTFFHFIGSGTDCPLLMPVKHWGYGMNSQTDIFQEALKLVSRQICYGYELSGLHAYTFHDGSLAYLRIRLKKDDKKLIFPMHKNDQGVYVLKEPNFNGKMKPVYRCHELTNSTEQPVYVVEGESCADKLAEMGLMVTTSGSSSSAKNADWSPLAGRTVIIWRDADDACYLAP